MKKSKKAVINIAIIAIILAIAILWFVRAFYNYSEHFNKWIFGFDVFYFIVMALGILVVRKIVVYFIFERKEKPIREVIKNIKVWLGKNWFKLSILVIILLAFILHFYITIQNYNLRLVNIIEERCYKDGLKEFWQDFICVELYNQFGIFTNPAGMIISAIWEWEWLQYPVESEEK